MAASHGHAHQPHPSGAPPTGLKLCEADDGGAAGSKPVLVLGAGWVGSRLAQSLVEDGTPVCVTNRPGTSVDAKPPYFRPVPLDLPEASVLRFDMAQSETWENLPPPESLSAAVVTFPLSSGPHGFWDAYLDHVPNVICYSTTSVYQVDQPGERVDEDSPLRETPRALAELYCQERGATLLTISGIFGERRSPRGICTCLSTYTTSGGSLNGNKRVNMVHVDDVRGGRRANQSHAAPPCMPTTSAILRPAP